jgi:hypothetical protein
MFVQATVMLMACDLPTNSEKKTVKIAKSAEKPKLILPLF